MRSLGWAGAGAAVTSLALASGAAAHGVGGRGDLPISRDLFVGAAVTAVVVSFAGVVLLWTRPVLAARSRGVVLGPWSGRAARAGAPLVRTAGLALLLLTLVSAWAGTTDASRNFAPTGVYVVFWVGVAWLSALAGPVWRALNPWDTLVLLATRSREPTPDPAPDEGLRWSHWPAAAGLGAFAWLELAYVEPASPRVVALAASLYTAAVLAGAAALGRRWLQTGEGFTVLFGLLAAMAPIGRAPDGRVVLRLPFTGLAAYRARRGTVAVLVVVLGGTTFDGLSRTAWWGERVRLADGWERTGINTVGLAVVIGLVAAAYAGAAAAAGALGGRGSRGAALRYAHTLVPIALAYSVAHYFSLLVFEGQNAWRLLSDPLGRGWDLVGSADHRIDYLALTAGQIAAVQTLAMVVGHVAGVVLAHDRALEDLPRERVTVSQIPLLAVMVAFTVVGLVLLLSA